MGWRNRKKGSKKGSGAFSRWIKVFWAVFFLMAIFVTQAQAALTYIIYYSANDGGPNWRILSAGVDENGKESERRLVIDLGPAGSLDSGHTFSQSVLREDGKYKMWYGGYDGKNWRILRASSPDGIYWTKEGLCLSLGPADSFDSVHMVYPYVLKEGSLYKMWYTAYDGKEHWRIGYAESTDGIIFKNRRVALDIGPQGSLDAEHVHTPVVIKQGGIYTLFYAGFGGTPQAWRILRATSTDGLNWTKQGLALDLGGVSEFDSFNLLPASAIYQDGLFKLFYWAHGDIWRIFSAVSKNSIDWEKKGVFLDAARSVRALDFRGLAVPAVMLEELQNRP